MSNRGPPSRIDGLQRDTVGDVSPEGLHGFGAALRVET